jgi:hypothetical protein
LITCKVNAGGSRCLFPEIIWKGMEASDFGQDEGWDRIGAEAGHSVQSNRVLGGGETTPGSNVDVHLVLTWRKALLRGSPGDSGDLIPGLLALRCCRFRVLVANVLLYTSRPVQTPLDCSQYWVSKYFSGG